MIIKESTIRQYVRSLIREALETEAVEDPNDIAEREKMMSGMPYDRSNFPNGGKSFRLERQYRAERGLPPLRKPKGGVVPYLIGADGSDITPENSPEALQRRINNRIVAHRQKMARHFVKNAQKEAFANARDIDANTLKNKRVTDSFANNVEKDPIALKSISMTPEERKAEAERIRRERIQKSVDDNNRTTKMLGNIIQYHDKPKTEKDFADRIATLREQQKALGPHTKANHKAWRYYQYIINDTIRIKKQLFGDKLRKINPLDHNEDDDIVKAAFNDISSNDMKQEFQNEFGDALVDPSEFNNGMQQNEEPKTI